MIFFLALAISHTNFVMPFVPPPSYPLEEANRILFLGNSITYAGEYVSLFETFFRIRHPSSRVEIINAGLPSETVSGLSEPGHADGRFPRPWLFDRLTNLLDKTRPDVVFACYGMNDGIYLPFSEDRFKAYQAGIMRLRDELLRAGVKRIIFLTPPVHDDAEKGLEGYNLVLDRYTDWLLRQQNEHAWEVIDLHYPMRTYLTEQRKRHAAFRLAADGVHPQSEGHWLMAQSIYSHFDAHFERATTLQRYMESAPQIKEIYMLVSERQSVMKDTWLTYTGHHRPGMQTGLPIKTARKKYRHIALKIRKALR